MKETNIVNVGYDSTNYYIVESTIARLLVDTGLPTTMPKLRHSMNRAGVDLASVGFILATHYHPDHAGLIPELEQQGVKPLIIDIQLPFIPLLRGYGRNDSRWLQIMTNVSHTISVGQSRAFLEKLGFQGEIVATPGHSEDSISLILDSGAAFVGDLSIVPSDDDIVSKDSWTRIRNSGTRTIYPGHGPVMALADVRLL